eukprot:6220149-Amphidinium_carterae.1
MRPHERFQHPYHGIVADGCYSSSSKGGFAEPPPPPPLGGSACRLGAQWSTSGSLQIEFSVNRFADNSPDRPVTSSLRGGDPNDAAAAAALPLHS